MLDKKLTDYFGQHDRLSISNFSSYIKSADQPVFLVIYSSREQATKQRSIALTDVFSSVYEIYLACITMAGNPTRLMHHPPVKSAIFDVDAHQTHHALLPKVGLSIQELPALAVFDQGKFVGVCRWNENSDILEAILIGHTDESAPKSFNPTDPQPNEEPSLANHRRIVRELKTCAITYIPNDVHPFGFTIGLPYLFKHPEVFIQLPNVNSTGLALNFIADEIKRGRKFENGFIYNNSAVGFKMQFFHMSEKEQEKTPLGYSYHFHQSRDFPVLRCIYSDPKGNFPWDSGCSPDVVRAQRFS